MQKVSRPIARRKVHNFANTIKHANNLEKYYLGSYNPQTNLKTGIRKTSTALKLYNFHFNYSILTNTGDLIVSMSC